MLIADETKAIAGEDKVPTKDEVIKAEETKINTVIKCGNLNETAYSDLILLIDTTTDVRKVAFKLVKNAKNSDYPEASCNLAWAWLTSKYAPRTVPSLLKLKHKFIISSLKSIKEDSDEWISKLESL